MSKQRTIVAECTISYSATEEPDEMRARVDGPFGTIAKRFEHAIDVNELRGYALRDWRMTSTPCHAQVGTVAMTAKITETIVAVFHLVDDDETDDEEVNRG